MAELLFFSGGVNAESNVLDSVDNYSVYASGNALVKIEKQVGNVFTSVPFPKGHTDHIHSVRISECPAGKKYVITASADNTVKLWSDDQVLVSIVHSHPVLYAQAFDGMSLIIAYDYKGDVLVYARNSKDLFSYSLSQKISYGPKLVHSVALSPEGILAIGTSDKLLRLLTRNNDGMFHQVCTLSGHVDWATSLEWSPKTFEGLRYLSSCGPDKTVRVWKLSKKEKSGSPNQLLELIPQNNTFQLWSGEEMIAENAAILLGHEGMVNSCKWARPANDGDCKENLRLVSASTDNSIIIWGLRHSIWSSMYRIGDISGSSTVGGDRSFGYFSALLSGKTLMANNSNGTVHIWNECVEEENLQIKWKVEAPITGHFRPIECCSWEKNGKYLVTASKDQTSRIFAPSNGNWFEIARPQIHGYDLQTLNMIDNHTFMSGADEKVIRVFQAPDSFMLRLKALSGKIDENELKMANEHPVMVPALGLSNKASHGNNDQGHSQNIMAEMPLSGPPTDSDLSRYTLWPEIDKLYGHGYEIYSLAVDNSGRLAASAGKANLSADAGIRFWMKSNNESSQWIPISDGHIKAHSLTVVNLKFSPSGKYLLATSRDRTWSITEISQNNTGNYGVSMFQKEEAHCRIVWSGAWLNDESFVTVSRDKSVKTWTLNSEKFTLVSDLTTSSGATAVDICGDLMAVGLESGLVCIYRLDQHSNWSLISCFESAVDTITDLKWRPGLPGGRFELATVSKDRSLRIHHVIA